MEVIENAISGTKLYIKKFWYFRFCFIFAAEIGVVSASGKIDINTIIRVVLRAVDATRLS